MMETLSTRAERLSVQTSIKRIFYLGALLGLISLVGVCVVLLPWNALYTQGQWVAFVFIAAVGFCWMSCLAALGQLQNDMPRTVKSMSWMLTFVTLVQIAMGLFLEYQFVTKKSEGVLHCLTVDATYTDESCTSRINAIIIAFPIIVFLLPLLSIPLLYLLFRHSSNFSTHLYSNLNPSSSDLPPNWNVPPETLAPDSSASDQSDDERERLRGKADGAGDSWYEMGKREKGFSASEGGRSWSEVRKERKGRNSRNPSRG